MLAIFGGDQQTAGGLTGRDEICPGCQLSTQSSPKFRGILVSTYNTPTKHQRPVVFSIKKKKTDVQAVQATHPPTPHKPQETQIWYVYVKNVCIYIYMYNIHTYMPPPPKKKVVTPWNSPINSEWLNKHQQPFLDSASSLRSFRQALKLRLGGLGSDGVSCGVLPRFFPKFDNEKKAKTNGSYPNEATFPTKPHIIHLQRGFTLNLPVTRPDRPRNSLSFFMVVACCPSSLWSTRIKTMSRG